jgi:hypothetical protein
VLRASATWTGDYLTRPAKVDRVHESTLWVSEISDCLLQTDGLFVRHIFALTIHLDAAYRERICVSSIYLPR